jgi:hypothetical protein
VKWECPYLPEVGKSIITNINLKKGRAISGPAFSLLKSKIDFLLSYKGRIVSPLTTTSRKNTSLRFKLLPKYFPPI